MAELLADMAAVLFRVRDTGVLSQLIVNECCRMFHTPGAILHRLGPLPKNVPRVAVSEAAASEAEAHLSLAEGLEIVGLEMGEPTPFTTADQAGRSRPSRGRDRGGRWQSLRVTNG